jgi:hypothetical protein
MRQVVSTFGFAEINKFGYAQRIADSTTFFFVINSITKPRRGDISAVMPPGY